MFKVRVLLVIILTSVIATSCSIPAEKPEFGVYFCDELNISIDFSKDAYNMAKLHHIEDNKPTDLVCYFDYGDGVEIFEAEFTVEAGEKICSPTKYYILGSFKWKDEELRVKNYADKKTFVFEKQEEDALS